MGKSIGSGVLSDPLVRLTGVTGRFGPDLDELLSPVVLAGDATGAPYAALGWFDTAVTVGAVALQFSRVFIRPQGTDGTRLLVLTRVWWLLTALEQIDFRVETFAALGSRLVSFTDKRRSTMGTVTFPTAPIDLSFGTSAAAVGGQLLSSFRGNATPNESRIPRVLRSDGGPFEVVTPNANVELTVGFEGIVYEQQQPSLAR